MASTDWKVLTSLTGISHSLVDTLGLVGMEGSYVWNVRTTANGGSYFISKNISNLVGTAGIKTKACQDNSLVTNLKIRCLVRRTDANAIPFLFLRGGTEANATNSPAYKFAFTTIGNTGKFALYKESLEGSFTTPPIAVSSSLTSYSVNTTYWVEFLIYSQDNHDTFIEAYLLPMDGNGAPDPYGTPTTLFKTMIFYSDSPILTGYCGFGHYGSTVNSNSFFDMFEVYQEQA